jgi:U32 family peptidase
MTDAAFPEQRTRPAILAPAGDRQAFLAALAAGADAVYCGLKHFSARMEAENFSLRELAGLTALAHAKGRRVLVAMNTLLKPRDLSAAGRLVDQLQRMVRPDGLIVQDLGLLDLARQAGFSGEMHLSTLACVSSPGGLAAAQRLGARQVVLPRELNLDEIKDMARACPPGLELEVFIHGALCYAVSGRCYWSSYMGGKSGLRGRCVQPCRRLYRHEGRHGGYFSCQDLSLDVLVKTLLDIPEVRTWKIEGRKKSAHYVFHTVTAYRMLRDAPGSAQVRKDALGLLEMALGRPGSHAGFLPQRPYMPLEPFEQHGSGLLAGRIPKDAKSLFVRPRIALQPGDLLRLGSEDQPWHRVIRVTRFVPKGGRFELEQTATRGSKPGPRPPAGVALWLVDRREPELRRLLQGWEQELSRCLSDQEASPSGFAPRMPRPPGADRRKTEMRVSRRPLRRQGRTIQGMWLDPKFLARMAPATCRNLCWWLPPVIWPNEEKLWEDALERVRAFGAGLFVCNAPWQIALFGANKRKADEEIWAGPFCNTANALAVEALRRMGFAGAIVSPELDEESFLALPGQASLPLGVLLQGAWPLAISRLQAAELHPEKPVVSPKGETAWARNYGQNLWIFPDWSLDLTAHLSRLESAGYGLFVHLHEKPPAGLRERPRASAFNWELRLL